MRGFRWLGLVSVLALSSGCTSPTPAPGPTLAQHPARTDGGAVVLSADERIAVACNRSAGVVTVFALDPALGAQMVTGSFEIDTGEGSEPWAAVIGSGDDTAYIVLRKAQTLLRINTLRSTPTLDTATVALGSEPSDIAISPSGKVVFVSNWGEGTVSVIDTSKWSENGRISLNEALVDTGVLGNVDPRPALAHPYALAMTNNGDADDLDETLYVTDFFSQPNPLVPSSLDLSHADRNRLGLVYSVPLVTAEASGILIEAVENTGVLDGAGRPTGCFPNQLYGAAVDGGRLYLTNMCTSPRGPLGPKTPDGMPTPQNFKTLFHPAVFVVDTATNLPNERLGYLLTSQLSFYYDGGEDASAARMPLIPNDIAFAPGSDGTSQAYLSALGADAIFRLDYDADGLLLGIGSPGARYIDVGAGFDLPVGVAVSRTSSPPFALAVNDASQRLAVIDRGKETVTTVKSAQTIAHAEETLNSAENVGRQFFSTGLDVWSLKGQAWGSCEACHPGGLSDGVTWYFARGPRRTLSAANTYEKMSEPGDRLRRLMLWGANIDEVHDIEGIVRSVTGGAGGVLWQYANQPSTDCRLLYDGTQPIMGNGSVPCQQPKPTTALRNGLNGSLSEIVGGFGCKPSDASCDEAAPDWNYIDAFIRSLRVPRAPTNLDADDIAAGREVFRAARCSGCHAGANWTLSTLFYKPGAEQNGDLPYGKPTTLPPLGELLQTSYTVDDPMLRALNPPAAADPNGTATFRRFAPLAQTDAATLDFVYDAASWGNDQLQCALRDVGTFPKDPIASQGMGIAADGAPVPIELRQDGVAIAQGASGFNIPALFGLAVGAPYFHAGNARTLEELLDDQTFGKHHRALAPEALGDPELRLEQIRQLVAFLLSIDESTELEDVPGGLDYDFCK